MTAPAPAQLLRRALLGAIALGPALWLLGRPLLDRAALPGVPSAGIYALLHRFWSVGAVVPERFPSPGASPHPEAIAWLLRPLIILAGPDVVVRLLMLGGLVATLSIVWRYARTLTTDWTAAAATAAATASPAVIAGVASGDLEAWHLWGAFALPLTGRMGSVATGIAIAVLAPTQLPVALLPVVLHFRVKGDVWPVIGWLVGMITAAGIGWPELEVSANHAAWFTYLQPASAPERVFQVYVGFFAAILLCVGAVGKHRGWALLGALAMLGALLQSPLPPERFLQLVPFAALLSSMSTLRRYSTSPVPAILFGTALLSEGWKGVATNVPLDTASLSAPAPISELAPGPVLDLPATRGAIRRALWYQTLHGHPIAADAGALVTEDVARVAAGLSAGSCADLATIGFTNVIARREASFRELGKLEACLGKPSWDDGAVAVWRVGERAPEGEGSPSR